MKSAIPQINYKPLFFPFPPELTKGNIISRYKRFLCDVKLSDNSIITAHVPNSGSMQTCWQPDAPVILTRHPPSKTRKLNFTLQAVQMPDAWVSVNTMNPNRAVAQAILNGSIPGLDGYEFLQTEVKTSSGSRFDLVMFNEQHLNDSSAMLSLNIHRAMKTGQNANPGHKPLLIEIKNATLRSGSGVTFPDSITTRGQKHLQHLMHYHKNNLRCMMLFFAGRSNTDWVGPAAEIDPIYARLLKESIKSGVEAIAAKVEVSETGLNICGLLPVKV